MVKLSLRNSLWTTGFLFFILFSFPLLAQNPDSPNDRYLAALKLIGQEKYADATGKLQALIAEHPGFRKSYKSLAELYICTDRIGKGEKYFRQLMAQNPENAGAYSGLANLLFQEGKLDFALDTLKICIRLAPRYIDAYDPHAGIVAIYQAKHDLDGAIGFLKDQIEKDKQNPCFYYALGRAFQRKYQWDKSLEMLRKATELDSDFALTYHSLLSVYQALGRYKESLKNSQKLFELAQEQNDPKMSAYALSQIGTNYYYFGDYWNAIKYYNRSLELARLIGDKRRQGITINNLAIIYAMLGKRRKARQYFQLSLDFARKTGSSMMEVRSLLNLGNVYKEMKNYPKSIEQYRAALDPARKNGYRSEESLILTNMAETYQKQKQYSASLKYYRQALVISRAIGKKAQIGYILRALGSLNLELGHFSLAIDYLNRALRIGLETNDLQILWEAQAGLGSSYKNMRKPELAIAHYQKAIALYDSVRANLDIESLTENFLNDKYQAFPSIVQLLAQQKKYEAAFQYAEKYKSKILLDILAEGQLYIENLIPDSLQQALTDLGTEIENTHQKLAEGKLREKQDQNRQIHLDQQLTDLELKKAALIEKFKKEYPAYYQLTGSELLSLPELQRYLTNPNRTLIEYIRGKEKISVFVITSKTVHYAELLLSGDALEKRFNKLSPLFNRADSGGLPSITNAQIADFSVPTSFQLYKQVFLPIEPFILPHSDLIIVPDDLLFYLPFEMLIYDTTDCRNRYDFRNAKFLLEKYAISYYPAVNLMNHKLQTERHSHKNLFAVGNPYFGKQAISADKTDKAEGNLLSLPNAENEVKIIAGILPHRENRIVTGRKATETLVKKEASDFKIIHFATHFLSNDRQPLYSKLAFSRDDNGTEDGFLHTYEIFNLHFNADLAVLSACNTALGNLSKGEGLIGVDRAFLYSGVPSLVLSLWAVNDKSTAQIMTGFYRNLQAGLAKDLALQQAKLNFLNNSSSEQADPFYWAPFILVGSRSPVEFFETESNPVKLKYWIFILAFAAIAAIGVYAWRKKR